ncbi:substrate-binding domain-containing protein [Curtobacterium flaccumfaciens]|nr:substrate-binding domain-containing protein [Curtobacterium flaccumfaciens]
MAGFRLAHERRDLVVDDALVVHSDFEVEGGVVGAHTLLSLSDPPTAIFAVNDTAAIGVMGAARQRGLRVPDDLSIVGYNDISVVAQLPTPMTTVHSPTALMGTVAVERLLAAIGDGTLQGATLPGLARRAVVDGASGGLTRHRAPGPDHASGRQSGGRWPTRRVPGRGRGIVAAWQSIDAERTSRRSAGSTAPWSSTPSAARPTA